MFEPVLLKRIAAKASPWLDAYRADGAEEPVADFVTPRDLSESPNLRLVGRLELPA